MSRGHDPIEAVSSIDERLGPVIESFLARYRRGERPGLTDLVTRHPDLAGPILELLPALVELEQVGGAGGVGGEMPSPSGERPSGDDDTAPSPGRLGDYRLHGRIGGGGMGVVYEAEHQSLRSRVAIKVIHPRFRGEPRFLDRFIAEARLAAGLHHTNIVGVFDYGEHSGVCYYAMPLIRGRSLDLVLDDLRRLRSEDRAPDAIEAQAAARGLFTGRFDPPLGTSHPFARAAIGTGRGTYDVSEGTFAVPSDGHDSEITAPILALSASEGIEVAERDKALDSSATSSFIGRAPRYFREVARLAAQVAEALEYAHRRNVLHRDIKPSNLLLDATGNAWVTDFGLAKLEESADLTQSHELVGTLRYMAPERLRGTSIRAADVYSLGATLYELATLRPPFEEKDRISLMERIREGATAPPREIDRQIPRDLETIILKAMARDPKDRFVSASEMAAELRRFVDGRPIRSRPISIAEQFWRWCKRDPKLAGACSAAAALTIVLAVGSTWSALVLRDQVSRTRDAERATRKNLFNALVAEARGTRLSRRPGQRFEALKSIREAATIARELGLPASDLGRLRDEAIAAMALPDLRPEGRSISLPPGSIQFGFDREMARYAVRDHDGTILVRDARDDREIARFRARGDRDIWMLQFSSDGRYLASDNYTGRDLRVWEIARGAEVLTVPGPVGMQADFRPDSRRILVGEGSLGEYDLETGRLVHRFSGHLVRATYRLDGARIAAVDDATTPPTCRIFGADPDHPIRSFPLRVSVDYLAWSPDGRTLATARFDGKVDLWDTETGNPRATAEGHDPGGLKADFHPSGLLMASNGFESQLRLWDTALGRPLLSLTGASEPRFSRDGRIGVLLVDRLTPYRVEPGREHRAFARASRVPMDYGNPSIRKEGRILAVGTSYGVILWDLADGRELALLPIGLAWHARFDPSGDLLTNGSAGGRRWSVRLDESRSELAIGPPRRLPLPATHGGMALDRSGRIVAAALRNHAVVTTPDRTFAVGPLDDCRSVAVSPDGRYLATGTHVSARGAQVWRIADGSKAADLPIADGANVAFTPDGRWLVTTSPRSRFWEVDTWRERLPSPECGSWFSDDGRITVVIEPGRILRLVEFATGKALARLESPDLANVWGTTLSPSGAHLVTTSRDRKNHCVHVWDLRAIRSQLAELGLDWEAPPIPDAGPGSAIGPLKVSVDLGPFTGIDEEAWSLFREAQAIEGAGRTDEAIAAFRRIIVRYPSLAEARNTLAWQLATRAPRRARAEAVDHARRAVAVEPLKSTYLNTLGVALYRDGRPAEAIPVLERSLAAGLGLSDPFDLFFLAMARHRLGQADRARADFNRAVAWIRSQKSLLNSQARELSAFRAEAEAILAGPPSELPVDLFAPLH